MEPSTKRLSHHRRTISALPAVQLALAISARLWLLTWLMLPLSQMIAWIRERAKFLGLAGAFCFIAGLAIAGPSGVLAWSENLRLRDQRSAQLAVLEQERATLEHRVILLDPNSADPDLVNELIRENLNVVHPDEVVVTLAPPGE